MLRIVFGKVAYGRIVNKNEYYYIRCLSCSNRYVNFASNQDNKRNEISNTQLQNVSKHVLIYRKGRYVVDVFVKGFKNLVSDIRLALKTRRKLGLYYRRDYRKLTREEVRHMRQTKEDVVKTFPVTFLFMIPFIGYAAPVLAYFYPRQLLSQQFWHPDQRKEFILEEYEKRSQYYLPLIKELAVTCKEIKSRQLYKLCLSVINGEHPLNTNLLKFKDEFSRFEDFSLRNVPRYHLVKLCKCWLIPTGWFLPRWYLMKALKRRITLLHEDDILILREGIDGLSKECISKAVHVRGLDESSLNMSSQILWLKDWLNISKNVSGTDVSFIAHCAVFKAANFENIAKGNGNQTRL